MTKDTYQKIIKLLCIAGLIVFLIINANNIWVGSMMFIGFFKPFIIGCCIAFILNLPLNFFEKYLGRFLKKGARGVSILLTFSAFIIVLSIIFSMIIPEVVNSFTEIKSGIPSVMSNLDAFVKNKDNAFINSIANMGIDLDKIIYSAEKNMKDLVKNIGNYDFSIAFKSIFSATTNVFSTFMTLLLSFIFAIYILAQKEVFLEQIDRMVRCVFNEKKSQKIFEFMEIVHKSFAKFIVGQGTEAVILGMLFLVSMILFKIPKAVPISATIGVFSLVPIFGALIGALFGVLAILITSPIKALWFFVLYLVVQQLEGNLIYPRVVGKSVGLPGILVLLAITVGGSMGGIVGMILSVPIMSIIYTFVVMFLDKREKNNDVVKL